MICRCSEASVEKGVGRKRLHPVEKDPHSCRYIENRNALIPAAEALAADLVGPQSPHWGPCFLWAMEVMAAEARAAGTL